MEHRKESGYVAISAILFATVTGLALIANQNNKTALTVKSSQVRKQSLQAEELALYSFSVFKQLLGDGSAASPIRLSHEVDPAKVDDITLLAGNSPSGTAVSLTAARELMIGLPDVVENTSAALDSAFLRGSFAGLDRNRIPVRLRVTDFEPYPSGFGVRSILVSSLVSLKNRTERKSYEHFARIPVPLGPLNCSITVQGRASSGGNLLISQASATAGILINGSCSGEIIHAELQINGIPVRDVSTPSSLNPLFADHRLTDVGAYEIRLRATRVDSTGFDFGPLTLTIAAPTAQSADYMKCMYKCTCEFPNSEPPTLCSGYTDFYNPFSPHVVAGKPLPSLPGNPEMDPNAAQILEDWAYANGAKDRNDTFGPKIQGLLFPGNGYGRKLVCSKVGGGGGWDSYAFDPDNNCQEEFIGKRGTLGCLLEGTQILVGPGELKPIENLTKSDRIWNPLLSRYYEIDRLITGAEMKDLYVITVGGRSVTMTFDHPILTARGYLQAIELESGDKVWLDSAYQTIDAIERQKPDPGTKVWNLVLKDAFNWDEHLIFADGIAVGDLWMQTELAKKLNHEK